MSMIYERGVADQPVGAQVNSAINGAPFTGTVIAYVIGDAGTRLIGSVNSGICTNEGGGYYTYRPSAAEMDFALVAVQFTGTNAITATTQLATLTLAQQSALAAAAAPGAVTAADLCLNILVRLGVIQAGEAPIADDQALVLDRLNTYVDGLATESLTMFEVRRATWNILAGVSDYTVGDGGTINIQRPVSSQAIDRVTFIDPAVNPNYERTLRLITPQAYESIILKSQSSPYPGLAYYNPTYGTTQLGTLTLWMVPNQNLTGVIYTPQAVAQMGLSTTISLPPGFRRFLETNIAVEVAPDFSTMPSPILLQAARESRANIQRVNAKLMDLQMDPALTARGRYTYNIFVDS
jgi:hypothetical protein